MQSTPPADTRNAAPRASASVVVVRDVPGGIETLLLRRAERGDRASGVWVFPGGLLDAADRDCHRVCSGLDDATASARLGVASGGLDYYVAAVRECFEECGLLYARYADDPRGEAPLVGPEADREIDFDAWRGPLHRNESQLFELCFEAGLRLAVDRLVYFDHWITPLGRAKRYDTRFFIAQLPEGQAACHDAVEMTAQQWIAPRDALAQRESLNLMTPTRSTLETLAGFSSCAALLAWAGARTGIRAIQPRLGVGRDGQRPVVPSEPAWAEIGRIDPAGRGHASYDIVPGRAVRLSPRVVRVTADNAGMMTGPGTNTYLVGEIERNEWAVIDPGPADPSHVDHSPAAALLQQRTGATVHGRLARHPERQDPSFFPDIALEGGERLALGAATTLRAIATPGHASNHLCYLLEEERTLFAGDHVMQRTTVVISPPDGDMAAYLASLRALQSEPLDWIAPGHGFLIAEPHATMAGIVEHRLRREAKVADALRRLGPIEPPALLAAVYGDVAERLLPVAARSLLAHLLKLEADGAARHAEGRWAAA